MRLNLRTTKYYPVPSGPHFLWTDEDWERTAFFRTEPKRIRCMGYMWRTLGARTDQGHLLYHRAEKL